jgi:non-heme chloroperoxidase
MAYAENAGVRIYYEVAGSGPWLVLLHGVGSDGQVWQENGALERFLPGYTVVTIDARGLGSSDRPTRVDDYRRELRRDDTIAVLDAIGAEQVRIVGYSLGGRSAIYVATEQPERVVSTVVVAANPFPTPVNLELTSHLRPPVPPRTLRGRVGGRVRRLARRALGRSGPKLSVEQMIRLADSGEFDVDAALRAMTMPSLFLIGEHDQRFDVNLTRQFAEQLPRGEFELVPGENHGMLRRLGPELPRIEAFLSRVEAPTG